MKVIHFLVGRPKSESSNGIVKAVYFQSIAESKLCIVETWAISKHVNEVKVEHFDFLKRITIPNNFLTIIKYIIKTLRRYMKSSEPIIFHLHGVFNWQNWLLGYILFRYKLKYIVSPHGGLMVESLKVRNNIKMLLKPIVRCHLKNATTLRALTCIEAHHIKEYTKSTNIVVIPNGVNVRRTVEIPIVDRHTFIFVGRLDVYHKGLDLLLEAAKYVYDKSPKFLIRLIGPNYKNGAEYLNNKIESLGLRKVVFIHSTPVLGESKDKIIQQSYYYIQTSRFEGLPIGLLEAMALGVPVIITNVIDPYDLVKKHNCGYTAELTQESISMALIKAISTPVDIRNMQGRNAQKVVFDNFNWDKIAQELVHSYKRLLVGNNYSNVQLI